MYPYLNWMEFINEHLNHSMTIDENAVVIVVDKNYLLHLNDVITLTSQRVIANYFAWRIVLFGSDLLDDALYQRKRKYSFEKTALTANVRIDECVKKTIQL